MTAASQIAGFTSANVLEVEANTHAARVTLRPEDYGSLGIYSLGGVSGTMAAGLAANAPIFSFRWTDATKLCLVKRITLSAGQVGATAFAAGVAIFNLFVARSFTVVDSGGASILPTGNMNKMRASGMGTSLVNDARIATTATLTAGTRTLDTNPVGSLVTGILASITGAQILAPYPMWDQRPGEHPLILAQNEGLILQATMAATGTWSFGIKIDWSELTAY